MVEAMLIKLIGGTMADNNYNPADNLSEEARAKGGRNSGASGAAGKTEAAKKGGKHSHGGGRRSR